MWIAAIQVSSRARRVVNSVRVIELFEHERVVDAQAMAWLVIGDQLLTNVTTPARCGGLEAFNGHQL
jgi:hypothetical protein